MHYSTCFYFNYTSYVQQTPEVRQISTVYVPLSIMLQKLHFSCDTVRLEMGAFYTLQITVQRIHVEQEATVYFPLSVGLSISQTPVTEWLRNVTSGTRHFAPPPRA
jgi:hypothetical protein